MRAANTEHVEHGTLGFEHRSATKRADLDRGHGHGDLKRATETRGVVVSKTCVLFMI